MGSEGRHAVTSKLGVGFAAFQDKTLEVFIQNRENGMEWHIDGKWETEGDLEKIRQVVADCLILEAEPVRMMTLNGYAQQSHQDNIQWWQHLENPKVTLARNKGELLMLIVSELAEAMEGERKELMDTKLPYRRMAEVELADALIRIFDYAGAFGYDLEGAYREKRAYNLTRSDHTREERLKAGGKKF